MSDFTVKCPKCGLTIKFSGDYWLDELLDDSQPTDYICPGCKIDLDIISSLEITLTARVHES